MENQRTKCYEFEVNGMHCAACELLLEDKLKDVSGVKSVKASLANHKVEVEFNENLDEEELAQEFTKLVEGDGYTVVINNGQSILRSTTKDELTNNKKFDDFIYAIPIAIIFLLLYAILQTSGIISTGETSSLVQTFILGVIASLSSCMALIGTLVLSLSNKYVESGVTKARSAQISFHLGRIIGFILLGGVLGIVGAVLKPTPTFTLVLTVAVSIIMFVLGLNQLNIFASTAKLQIKPPKLLSRKILSLQNLNYSFIPFLIGALTFFLPCGFTLAVQGVALEQGDFIQSALIMLSFALGTLPVLALLSFASINFAGKLKSSLFMKTTGLIIIAFALYNIYGALVANGLA